NVPLFAALALGMFWKRITGHGAFAGVATGMLAAFVHYGLSLSRGARPGVDGGFLAVVLPYYTPLAQALWTAIVAFTASAVVTIVVSLCTRPRPATELHGFVYSRASLGRDAWLAWWQRPVTLAVSVLAALLLLNLVYS
ncbi:MAG: Na+/galactose cotransporter, partial [Gemmatimonadota bacterium]